MKEFFTECVIYVVTATILGGICVGIGLLIAFKWLL